MDDLNLNTAETQLDLELVLPPCTDLMTYDQAAAYLKVSSATLRNWVAAGKVNVRKVGKKSLFDREALVAVSTYGSDTELLTRRANKKRSTKKIAPKEHSLSRININAVELLMSRLEKDTSTMEDGIGELVFAIALHYLNAFDPGAPEEDGSANTATVQFRVSKVSNDNLRVVLDEWQRTLDNNLIMDRLSLLEDVAFEFDADLLGYIYQSVLLEGKKIEMGSYYTPKSIVRHIVADHISSQSMVLDPCCGTGQFLMSFASVVRDPRNIYGFDTDPIAVYLARINLILAYPDERFMPNVFLANALALRIVENLVKSSRFDVIATNPPWGASYTARELSYLEQQFPAIRSRESFSYFLIACLRLLKPGGTLSFLLPEAVLNVRQHADLRRALLDGYEMIGVHHLGNPFNGVFTKVVRIDVRNALPETGSRVTVETDAGRYFVNQQRFREANDHVITSNVTDVEHEILQKIFRAPHTTLTGNAEWALGIVTGNNSKHISDANYDGQREPIYRGKDVDPFFLRPAASYIEFTPDRFQQVAPVVKYRAPEKLIYRFISNKLIFAYDDQQSLTLNSANILIPRGTITPMVLSVILNSAVYQFVFKKKHSSIKVLRQHLECLPLPDFDAKSLARMEELASRLYLARDTGVFGEVEDILFDYFRLDTNDRRVVAQYGAV